MKGLPSIGRIKADEVLFTILAICKSSAWVGGGAGRENRPTKTLKYMDKLRQGGNTFTEELSTLPVLR